VSRRSVFRHLLVVAITVAVTAAVVVPLSGLANAQAHTPVAEAAPAPRQVVPAPRAVASPVPAPKKKLQARVVPAPRRRPVPATPIVTVRPGGDVPVRSRPGGPVVASLTDKTEFGSHTTAPAYARRGRWLAVALPQLPNNNFGWVDARSRGLRVSASHLSIRINRARRSLELRAGRRLVLRATVGVGAPGSPTPAGRFAVTDELGGAQFSPAYGCCVLALSAHQPNPPAGWSNGTRMAIHGTNAPSTIGAAASAGCVHAEDQVMRVLMRRVPLGTPVLIS
jgi:lipoprotein-anchoring transpeptidase ErfK/SrfK